MRNPKISVVVPTYNQGQFIEQTLRSVVEQGYDNYELIVIDAASTDGTLSIIEKYKDRIAYFVSEKDKGQSDAINKGLAKATGEIVTWLNSDDYYLPGTLKKVAEYWERTGGFHFLLGSCVFIDEKGKEITREPKSSLIGNNYFVPFRKECIVMQPSSFFSLESFRKYGPLDITLHYSMDVDFWMKLMANGIRFILVNDYFTAFRRHEGAKSWAGNDRFLNETINSEFYTKHLYTLNKDYYYQVRRSYVEAMYRTLTESFDTKAFFSFAGKNVGQYPLVTIKKTIGYILRFAKMSIEVRTRS